MTDRSNERIELALFAAACVTVTSWVWLPPILWLIGHPPLVAVVTGLLVSGAGTMLVVAMMEVLDGT